MIVVLDACVLYPPSLRDLLLTLADIDAVDIRWSDEILDEFARNVLADNPSINPAHFAKHTIATMRTQFPEALIPVDPALVLSLDNDPKDRHVAAVAITAGAEAVVTLNVKDFRSHVLADAGVRVLTPGELVGDLLDDLPGAVVFAVQQISARWRNPRRNPHQVVEVLSGHPSMTDPMYRLGPLLPTDRW